MWSCTSHFLRHKYHTGAYSVLSLWMVCLQNTHFLCSLHLPLASRPVGRWMCRHLGLISVLSGMLIQFPVPEELCESDSLVGKHYEELSQAHSSPFPFLFFFVYLSFSDPCLFMCRYKKGENHPKNENYHMLSCCSTRMTSVLPLNTKEVSLI